MCDQSEPTTDVKPDEPRLNFLDLPNDVILKIFTYLDPLFLHSEISCVCRKFNTMLYWDFIWRRPFHVRYDLLHTPEYPYFKHMGLYDQRWKSGRDFTWRDIAVAVDAGKKRWFQEDKMISVPTKADCSNVVHVLNDKTHVLTGSRDGSLTLWDINKIKDVLNVPLAHSGWLSGIDTLDEDNLVTSGWDSIVTLWRLKNEELVPLTTHWLDMGVMQVACKKPLIAACTFPELILIDPRIGHPAANYRFPMQGTSAVQLSFWDNSIILATRSHMLIQFDLRAHKTVQVKVVKCVPLKMSILRDTLYIGDSKGKVFLYDVYNNFEFLDSFQVGGPRSQICLISPRNGYMIVGSCDGLLQTILSVKPMNTTHVISSLDFTKSGGLNTGHLNNGTLAVVTTNEQLNLFMP